MPQKISREKKTIKLDSMLKSILDLLKQCMDKHITDENDIENKKLKPSAERDNIGFLGMAWGSKICDLEDFEVWLDLQALLLRNAYIDYLNELLEGVGESSINTEKDIIFSRFVLVREILIRLVTLALSVEISNKNMGNKFIAVLEGFVRDLNKKELLATDSMLWQKQLSEFGKQLGLKTHQNWIMVFKQAVEVIAKLRTNSRAMSDILYYLNKTKLTIMRQLAVELDGKFDNIYNLSEDWIRKTLTSIENKILQLGMSNEQSSSSLSFWQKKSLQTKSTQLESLSNMSEPERQIKIISHFKGKEISRLNEKVKKSKKVHELYQILNQTNLLIDIIANVDFLITTTGWVPIIMGLLNIDILSKVIQEHGQQCNKILSLNENSSIFNSTGGMALITYGSAEATSLSGIAAAASNTLQELKNPELIKNLFKGMSGTLNELIQLQNALGQKLINPDLCANIQKSFLSSQTDKNLLSGTKRKKGKDEILPKKRPKMDAPSFMPLTDDFLKLQQKFLIDGILKAFAEWEKNLHHKSNLNKLKQQAKEFGFKCIPTQSDGNCFFYAILDQLKICKYPNADQLDAIKLRQRAVQYIIDNLDLYKDFIGVDLSEFILKISKGGAWADHVIIQALSRALNINIVMIRDDGADPTIIKQLNAICTVYLGYEVEWHYQSLHKDPAVKPQKDIETYLSEAEIDSPLVLLQDQSNINLYAKI